MKYVRSVLKKVATMFVMLFCCMFLTGCQTVKKGSLADDALRVVKQTFGKEYIKIDDFYKQLEADIKYSIDTQIDESSYSKNTIQDATDLIMATLKTDKEALIVAIYYSKETLKELGTSFSLEGYVEEELATKRLAISEELNKYGMELKRTELDRGLFGSIWHFIRKHWFISFIIFSLICSIPEKIQELRDKNNSNGSNDVIDTGN